MTTSSDLPEWPCRVTTLVAQAGPCHALQRPLPVSEPVYSLCEEVLEGPSSHMPHPRPAPRTSFAACTVPGRPGLRLPVPPVAGPRDRGAGQPRSHTRPQAAVAGSPALRTDAAGERSLALPPPKTVRPFSEMHPHAGGGARETWRPSPISPVSANHVPLTGFLH